MYTEQDIKDWFLYMIQKYKNSPFNESLKHVQDTMFNKDFDNYETLDNFIHNIKGKE